MRPLSVIAAACALALGLAPVSQAGAADVKHVAVTQIVEHPALDAAREGVREALAEAGWKVGENLTWTFESAQGSVGTAAQIAKKFVGLQPDVIVAIATPSARLVRSLENPGVPVTGSSDMLPLPLHLAMIRRALPQSKTVGVLYNAGEANSVALVETLKTVAPAQGFTIVESTAPRSSDVLGAARNLVGKVDAIYVPTDNTVISALEAVVKVGIDNKLPVFAGDTASVARGAVAATGFDYHDLGLQTGRMVARVLAGADPRTMPVETIQKTDLYVNPAMAERMGLTLPPDMIADAAKIIE